ncbi:sulfotransferase domain-containing protein [Planctomycetota bacterium]|nr:sulfotransferase domain-containing protein [Planctomycetota bacterium]MDB4736225.1 sulfotransferase domain-containing protein [Planctomycetota bacterium]
MTTGFFPNLYSIGAMRCATTTTHEVLGLHPEICMSAVKEPMFWRAESMRASNDPASADFAQQGRFRSIDQYRSLFDFTNASYRYFGESSHYLDHPELAPFIHRYSPRSKIIISIRNPIERLMSEYRFFVLNNSSNAGLDEWIECESAPGRRYTKGLYSSGASRFVEVFGRQQVHFRVLEDLVTDPQRSNQELFEFLDVAPVETPLVHRENSHFNHSPIRQSYLKCRGLVSRVIPFKVRRKVRRSLEMRAAPSVVSGNHEELSTSNAERLRTLYRDDIARISDLIGRDLTSLWASG